jgi:hypothetical protein
MAASCSGQITGPVSLISSGRYDDVLKSFTAWNPDTGALYSVGYTTGIPSSHMLSRFPFDITSAETGLGGFLLQVKGAEVKLDHSGKELQGKLVAVQQMDTPRAADYVDGLRLTVLVRDSLQTVWSVMCGCGVRRYPTAYQPRSYLEVLADVDVTRSEIPFRRPARSRWPPKFPL